MIDTTIVKDRYRNRRKMAWISFTCIIIFGLAVIAWGLSSDQNANRIELMSFFLGSIFGVWISIVLAYFGTAAITDTKEIQNEGHQR